MSDGRHRVPLPAPRNRHLAGPGELPGDRRPPNLPGGGTARPHLRTPPDRGVRPPRPSDPRLAAALIPWWWVVSTPNERIHHGFLAMVVRPAFREPDQIGRFPTCWTRNPCRLALPIVDDDPVHAPSLWTRHRASTFNWATTDGGVVAWFEQRLRDCPREVVAFGGRDPGRGSAQATSPPLGAPLPASGGATRNLVPVRASVQSDGALVQ